MSKEKMGGFRFLRGILSPLFKLWYNPTIIGKENIPESGAIIVAGNHKHLMDQCMIIISTRRPIHYMAKCEYWKGPFAWFFNMAGCIPVDRDRKDKAAVDSALEVLKNGQALGIFPEGTRNRTEELLLPFKFGCVSMAHKTDALIVPFGIYGDYKFRSRNLVIRIGKPFKADDDLEKANKKLVSEVTKLIKESASKNGK